MRKRVRTEIQLLAIICGLLLFVGKVVLAAEPATRPAGKSFLELPYLPEGHPLQRLDLYLPQAGSHWPLIVWIHGGAWSGGDKRNSPALRYLVQGYAVASVNYRLSQDALFPAQLEDCRAALRFLRAHAGEYGYDGEHIGIWGSSAGGHLAALLGTTGARDALNRGGGDGGVTGAIRCVVDYYGPTDLLALGRQAGPSSRIQHDDATSPESRLVGGPIQQHRDLATRANSITFITKDNVEQLPSFLIMHGDGDTTVPIEQSEMLNNALMAVGADVHFHVVAGGGHGGKGWDSPEVRQMTDRFFAEHLKNGAKP